MNERVVYAKGGQAIEEATRLVPLVGQLPDGGPDKFLLTVLFYTQKAVLRLVSIGPKMDRATISGIDVIEYSPRPPVQGKLSKIKAYLKAGLTFVLDTWSFKPTKILCGLDGTFALFVWLAAAITRAEFVFLAHGALNLSSFSRSYRVSNKFLCRRARWVVAHGPFVKEEALLLGARPDRVIEFNNGLDPHHRDLIQSLPPKNPAGLEILYLGRMEESKGVYDLFDAFLQLPNAAGYRLKFIGAGTANAVLKKMVEEGHHEDRIEVMGQIAHDETFTHLKNAGVVVTPSQSIFPEGYCKTAMEAFFVGTPVIAPDYGPFPYMIIDGENGLLYEVDSVQDLSKSIEKFFSDATLRSHLESGAMESGVSFMNPKGSFRSAFEKISTATTQR